MLGEFLDWVAEEIGWRFEVVVDETCEEVLVGSRLDGCWMAVGRRAARGASRLCSPSHCRNCLTTTCDVLQAKVTIEKV